MSTSTSARANASSVLPMISVEFPSALEGSMETRATSPMEVADQLHLGAEEVHAPGTDERDGFVEPAIVSLGGLIPGLAMCRMHPAGVRQLGGSRNPDVGRIRRHLPPAATAREAGRGPDDRCR